MASFLRKLFGLRRKKLTKKDSITGRNNSFPVPYLSKLEGNQLESGQSLIVRGVIISNEEFVINLTSGSRVILDEETRVLDDRLLCMKIELKKKRIRLNACINGEWGSEGFVKHKWKNGDEFDIRIRCHEDEFEVFVDHKLCARFGHYVPLTNISHLYVDGCVELYSVSWEGREYIVPYAADIPGNFYPGRRLYISGLIKKRAKHFQLILFSGVNKAFRMTTKFGFSKKMICDTQTTTQTTEEGGGEGEQKNNKNLLIGESPPTIFQLEEFPFRRKKAFDLLIYCEDKKFVIYIDDCLLGKYEHRINPQTIDRLSIEGDIVLHGVHLK
uniref:Galectin n=1 Tax=Meloidogyne enterolobii TaxID=390850 RepID=A0A6V7U1P9_MELEN|nr:unnamed protein product [Meloidogyne enterolobii]